MKFSSRWTLLALTVVCANALAQERAFDGANSRGVVGETDHLALVDAGITSRPYYNDYAGGTDKYLTHASSLSGVVSLGAVSIQPGLHWRLITPNLWDPLAEEDVASQPAPFADWLAVGIALRHGVGAGYVQVEYERGQFGDFGGDGMQRKMHDTIRRYTQTTIEKNEYWMHRVRGQAEVIGGEIGSGDQLREGGRHLNMAAGVLNSPLTRDLYVVVEYLNKADSAYHWAGQTRIVRQLNSRIYSDPLIPWRGEIALSWQIRPWLMPSVKVISPIFRQDRRPQIYLDPVHLLLAF